MTIPAWPATLPQDLFVEGYAEASPNNILRSPMDAGPAKVRRRTTSAVRPVQGTQKMTLAQLEDFIEFYDDDLYSGSLRFTWTRPLDGSTAVEMRFTEAPNWTAITPDIFNVNMKLEILP